VYFVEKLAVYNHGVFYICEEKWEAEQVCDILAVNDIDDHHDWVVKKYIQLNMNHKNASVEEHHDIVYKTCRSESRKKLMVNDQ